MVLRNTQDHPTLRGLTHKSRGHYLAEVPLGSTPAPAWTGSSRFVLGWLLSKSAIVLANHSRKMAQRWLNLLQNCGTGINRGPLLLYFTPAPAGPGPPPRHHGSDFGNVYRGVGFSGFALFTPFTFSGFVSPPAPLGSWAQTPEAAATPHNKSPHNKRTRITCMSVSLRSNLGCPTNVPGREIGQSGYWKFDVDMSIVRIDSPLSSPGAKNQASSKNYCGAVESFSCSSTNPPFPTLRIYEASFDRLTLPHSWEQFRNSCGSNHSCPQCKQTVCLMWPEYVLQIPLHLVVHVGS